jgi:predicted dehydrogenase
MKGIRRIYVEKPLCVSAAEERRIENALVSAGVTIQMGFQYLQMPSVRRALKMWRSGEFGEPVHFDVRYLHDGYLDRAYRDARRSRLKPTPLGGALSDLGSHAISLLTAFLGAELEVVAARKSSRFPDVPADSDLCTTALLRDRRTGAAGSLVASRVSAGASESLDMELRGTRGAFRFSGERPDLLESAIDASRAWTLTPCGSEYLPASGFPATNVPGGWLRSLVHAHYLFFGGADSEAVIPDLQHGLTVQRLVRATAELLAGLS